MSADARLRFLFEGSACRGFVVRLEHVWQELQAARDYPQQVASLLGEAVAATALMAGSVKLSGKLSLQARGHGPVNLLVVQARPDGALRALAQWQSVPAEWDLQSCFGDQGQLSVVMTSGSGEPYQGVVSLQAGDFQAALGEYFQQSEQIPTRFWLVADEHHAVGLMLQRLPQTDGDDEDAWDRINHLAATVTRDELLQLPAEVLLQRLFHLEDVRLFDPEPLRFSCDCSRERISLMIRGLGYEEAHAGIVEQGELVVNCEFCNTDYVYTHTDIEQLFAADSDDSSSVVQS